MAIWSVILYSFALFNVCLGLILTHTTNDSLNEIKEPTSLTTTGSLFQPASGELFGQSIRQSRFLDRRFRYCPSLRNALPNGWVKLRSGNRIARFSCNQGFELIGNRYATCIRGRWNRDLPVCVSSYCPNRVSSDRPLIVKKLYHDNVIDLSCELGYDLRINTTKKSSSDEINDVEPKMYTMSSYPTQTLRIYCVGKKWIVDDWSSKVDYTGIVNRIALNSFPECEAYEDPVNKSMSCDFEESLCGWFQDYEDDFDWIRNHHTTPSYLDGTGPSYDHTYGKNNSGYYLYLESSYPRVPNEASRLYSPVYQHLENIPVACFQFYYHMYGKAIGSLRIYVKEKAQILKELNPIWELVGDQGDNWYLGQVEIRPLSIDVLRSFQIVIEGVLGHGHQGDIAIDDISLTLGNSCLNLTNSTDVEVVEINEEYNPDNGDTITSNEDTGDSEVDNNSTSNIPMPQGLVSTTNGTLSPFVTTASYEDDYSTSSAKNKSNSEHFIHSIFRTLLKIKTNRNSSITTSTTKSPNTNLLNQNVTYPPLIPLNISFTAPTTTTTTTKLMNKNGTKYNTSKWWKELHEHMKKAVERHETLLKELRNSTKGIQISLNNQTTTSSAGIKINTTTTHKLGIESEELTTSQAQIEIITLPSLVSKSSPCVDSLNETNNCANQQTSTHEQSLTLQQKNNLENTDAVRFGPSSIVLLLVCVCCFVLIVTLSVYFVHMYSPVKFGRSDINQFVVGFASRCNVFSRTADDGDSELLVISDNDEPTLGNNNQSSYDNSDGIVYLQAHESSK